MLTEESIEKEFNDYKNYYRYILDNFYDLYYLKKDYDSITDKKKKNMFDTDNLFNPYADTRILNIAEDKEIKKIIG